MIKHKFSDHSLLLIDGKVYGFGANSEEQLATTASTLLPESSDIRGLPTVFSPTEIPSLSSSIVRIGCGSSFSVALDTASNLYGWGSNDDGQLGLPEETESQNEPKGNGLDIS